MKAKINYKSRRTIIIIAIAVVLLIAAITGTVAFMKGNRNAAAAMEENGNANFGEEQQSSNEGTASTNNGNIGGNPQTLDGQTENGGEVVQPQVTSNEGNNNPNVDASANNNNANGTTTGTNTNNGGTTTSSTGATANNGGAATGTTVPNQDYTQTTTIITENPWETKDISWTPLTVSAYAAVANLNINKPVLEAHKIAYTNGNEKETVAQKGETITYVITVTNTGNIKATNIRTFDAIPEGTELIPGTITNNGTEKNGNISWKTDIDAGSEVQLSFQVKVIGENITIVENTAKVNGTETETTHTPIITTNKKANVVISENGKETLLDRDAKAGETIRYTITVENTSDYDGTTKVTDTVPEGTTIIETTISKGGKLENGQITWEEINVAKNDETTVSFDVKVNEDRKEAVKNKAVVGKTDTNEEETKVANITGKKEVNKTEAKVGDTLIYTITLENSGDADGKVTVTDRIPEGTTIKDETVAGYDKATNTMKWEDVEVKANDKKTLTLEVVINENTKTSVKNTAILDDEEIPEKPETTVANIKTEKRSESVKPLHEKDEITYTLSATNSGNGTGTVKISDKVPEGTTLVANSIKQGSKTYTEAQLNEGIDVTLDAGETKSITFKVTVNPFDADQVIIRNDVAKQDETPIPGTEDKVEKEYASVSVSKVFEDKDNVDGLRPVNVEIGLYKDTNEVPFDTIKLNNENEWKHTFSGLDKYDSDTQKLIKYSVKEIMQSQSPSNYVPSYDETSDGDNKTVVVTNTLKYENVKTSITANKVWEDNENKISARPTSGIVFRLYKDETETSTTGTIMAPATSTTFIDLQKYNKDGTEIKYTVQEETNLDHYNASYSEDGLTVTNTIDYTTFTTNTTVNKNWIEPDGITTHPTITINLYQNGNENVFRTETIANGANSCTFSNLPKYDENGNEYTYTAEEAEVPEKYNSSYSDDTLTITNTIKQENNVSISGRKTWVAPEDNRPEVTIELYKNGEKVDTQKVVDNKYSFDNLPKYRTDKDGNYVLDANGKVQLNEYEAREVQVSGFKSDRTKTTNGYDFKNTIEQDNTVSKTVNKIWKDPDNTEHKPITINLYRDNDENLAGSVTLNNNETTHTFNSLPKYDVAGDGHEYRYYVKEEKVTGYNTSYSDDTLTITNTIDQEKISIGGTKTWVDPEDTIHNTITIRLYRNEKEIQQKEVSTETGSKTATYSFDELDKYDEDGKPYNYTVSEDVVPNYNEGAQVTPTLRTENGTTYYDFTNTITQTYTSIGFEKEWVGPEATQPSSITINLYRDNNLYSTKQLQKGTTSDSFESLPEYAEDGHAYIYRLEEVKATNYSKAEPVETESGYKFTNVIEQQYTKTISGTKTWIAPNGEAHPEVTLRLYEDENGNLVESKDNNGNHRTITLENGTTSYSFSELPKYNLTTGNEIQYVVVEDEIKDEKGNSLYTSTRTATEQGFNFTNKIAQKDTSISGTKTWVGTPEGETHPTIEIQLYRNGNPVAGKTKTLKDGETTYTFDSLEMYNLTTGQPYEYTVQEKDVQNYVATYNGNDITNTYQQDIQGTITVTSTSTSSTTVSTPLDVVFVLDASGSMKDSKKYESMVTAVNTAIGTIVSKNSESRVGVVTYNESSKTLLELGKYTPMSGKYLTAKDNTIKTSVKEKDGKNKRQVSSSVEEGTYTQSGIKKGAEMLTKATTTWTTTINNKEKTLTRTPVIILLSDGEPTYYNSDYNDLSGNRNGSGSETTVNESYYTIRTAKHWKDKITSHYYGSTDKKAKFYTIGFNLSGQLAETILNPTAENVNACKDKYDPITDNWGYDTGYDYTKMNLYNKITENDTPAGAYSYSDGYQGGTMSTEKLEEIFNTVVNDNTESTADRQISKEESDARRVNLDGIDTSKDFELTIGSKTYTFNEAKTKGYVKGNKTDGYYVDLSTIEKGTNITISYNQ